MYSSESVETIICLNIPELWAAKIEYAIVGFPSRNLMFFPGVLLLPDLAGIKAMDLG